MAKPGGAANVAGRPAPGYCHVVSALGTGAGAPDGGIGRDPPDQARPVQLAEEQAALRRVATLVARAAPPEQVFAAVAGEVGRLLAVDFAILVRYDPRDTLEVVGTWTGTGAPPATPVGGRLPLGGRNVTTVVYRTGLPARIDYSDVSGVIGRVASREWGLRSSVGVPVSAEGRVWGCIVVAFSGQELLPADTEARLASFTELVATAIANADSRAELARLAEEQAALRRVATLVAAGAPPEEAFAAVAEEAGKLFLVDVANMCRYEPDGTATIVASAWGRFAVGSRLKLEGKNVTTLVYQTGRAARIDSYADASGPLGTGARERGVRSSVATPIMVEGHLWGVLGIGASTERPLPPDAEARLASFTELVATAIANAESHAALTRLAEEQAALRRMATLVARGVPPTEIFSAVSDEVTRPVQGAGGGPQIHPRRPGSRLRRRLEDPRPPGRDAMGVPAGNGLGGGLSHQTLRPCRRDGLVVGQWARRGSRAPHGHRLDGREPDRCRGPSVGRDERRVHKRGPAVRYGGTPGEVHRAARYRDRERGEQVGAGRLAQADRRRVGPGPPEDRARSARRYAAATGLARAGGARRGGRWCGRLGRPAG